MSELFQQIIGNRIISFFLLLVPLVVIHEFGHFLIAKLGGIRVHKFAFGFGKKLFGFTYGGTDYRWNLLPLGGYVDLMGEAVYMDEIPDDAQHFYNRPKWLRFLVLVMGPAFNLILALLLFWMVFALNPIYTTDYKKEPYTIGFVSPDSGAAKAGLQPLDRIVSMNGEPVTSYDEVRTFILLHANQEVALRVERDGEQRDVSLKIPMHEVEGHGIQEFYAYSRVIINEVMEDSAASEAGLQPEDVITHINGEAVVPYAINGKSLVSIKLEERAPEPSELTIERNGEVITQMVSPRQNEEGTWLLGILMKTDTVEKKLSVAEAFSYSWDTCVNSSVVLFSALRKLVTGQLSVRTLSGPVEISRIASESIRTNIWYFLNLMAFLSLQLGILNLLPIPVLDGGEIFVLLVEGVTGRDFSLYTKYRIKIVGFVFLIALMGMVLIMDLVKTWQMW